MISVAMATYNGEKYIKKQLESIYLQTMPPDEVIICDDCSNDKTVDIIRSFIKDRKLENEWHLYINEKNIGYVENFRQSIIRTHGDIIFLSDQDDFFKNEKFEYIYNFIKKTPDCVLLNTDFVCIDEKSKPVKGLRFKIARQLLKRGKIERKLKFNEVIKKLNYPGFAMGFVSLVREELSKMDLTDFYGHDVAICMIALKYNGFYECRKVLSIYRLHNDNTSKAKLMINNSCLKVRILQKIKEVKFLRQLIEFNKVYYPDSKNIFFIQNKLSIIIRRILYMKKKKKFPLLLLVFNSYYSFYTIAGDIYMVLLEQIISLNIIKKWNKKYLIKQKIKKNN